MGERADGILVSESCARTWFISFVLPLKLTVHPVGFPHLYLPVILLFLVSQVLHKCTSLFLSPPRFFFSPTKLPRPELCYTFDRFPKLLPRWILFVFIDGSSSQYLRTIMCRCRFYFHSPDFSCVIKCKTATPVPQWAPVVALGLWFLPAHLTGAEFLF